MISRNVYYDNIHGCIEVDEIVQKIINTPEVQRLSGVKQLGPAYLIFPGANHTRLEHTIGVIHLAKKIGEKLLREEGIPEGERKKWIDILQISGALHDIGHGPFSHVSEILTKTYKLTHDTIAAEIVVGERSMLTDDEKTWLVENGQITLETTLNEIEKKYSDIRQTVSSIIKGKSNEISIPCLGCAINSDIDVDRMDYLARDSLHTGTAMGAIDINRLIDSLGVVEDRLGIKHKDRIPIAESLFFARSLMYNEIYLDKTKRAAEAMIVRAAYNLLESKKLKIEDLYRLTDFELLKSFSGVEGLPGVVYNHLKFGKLFECPISFG